MNRDFFVLGINYRPRGDMDIGHNPSAVLLKNGQPVAMCQEERFVRVKDAPGQFPINAIQFCLRQGGITARELAAIGWNWDPFKSTGRSLRLRGAAVQALAPAAQYALRNTPLRAFQSVVTDSLLPERVVNRLRSQLLSWLDIGKDPPLFCFDHHLSHAASAFYASGFQKATIVTWDCWGDDLSGMIARGHHSQIEVLEEIPFSKMSIGLLNDFVYEFLHPSEKGNLMGLAAYGSPAGYLDGLVDEDTLTMKMDLLSQHAPFPESFTKLSGPPRRPGEPIEKRHKDLAADLQCKIESIGMKIVKAAVAAAGERDLCLAGGCALNATLNGKIGRSGMVKNIFVQPEAGDAGGALGAAYLAHLEIGQPVPTQELRHAYWGPSYSTDQIVEQLKTVKVAYEVLADREIAPVISDLLLDQKIVGWFQLGSEWGPRALGARSILADPRKEEIRDRVNTAVKYRDWWRPFAPSILAEEADEYMEEVFFAPFMLATFPIRQKHAADMAGVTHLDGSTRPQMVVREVNERYYDTIKAFGQRSGVPMVLNTSFNLKGEPIVNSPRDALRTFFSSGLDALIMNNVLVRKTAY
jgi:carbamoyltransferase